MEQSNITEEVDEGERYKKEVGSNLIEVKIRLIPISNCESQSFC